MAKVYEYDSALFHTQITEKRYTGKTKTKTLVTVLGKDFPLYFKEDCGYEQFDVQVTEKPFLLFGFIETPIVVTTLEYTEYQSPRILLSKGEIEAMAELQFRQWTESLEGTVEQAEEGHGLVVSVAVQTMQRNLT